MPKIINSTRAQKQMSAIVKNIDEDNYIVTHHGDGRMIILPYFDGCTDFMDEYMEEYSIRTNGKALKSEIKASLASGMSDLKI